MKSIKTLFTLFIIFGLQNLSLDAMKRAKCGDVDMLDVKVRKSSDIHGETNATGHVSTFPKAEELGSYKKLLDLLSNPAQENFAIKATCCISGVTSIIKLIQAGKAKHANAIELNELSAKLTQKLLELQRLLASKENSAQQLSSIEELVNKLEQLSL